MFPKGTFLPDQKADSVSFYLSQADTILYNDLPAALGLLEKARFFAKKSNNASDMAKVCYTYAFTYYVKGDYGLALQYYLEAQEIYLKEGDQLGIAKTLVGQGLIQQGIDRHGPAIGYFRDAIAAYQKSGNPNAANPAYINIAISEIETAEFAQARKNLDTAVQLSKKMGRIDVEHLSLNRLGQINFLEGNPRAAIPYFNKVLQHEMAPSAWEKSFAHAGLAEAYAALGELLPAEENGIQALAFAEKVQSLWDLERNSKILSGIYDAKGETDKAYTFLKLNAAYKDSLYNLNKLREINLLQLESKESENLKLQEEREITGKQLSKDKVLITALFLVTVSLFFLALQFRRNSRQKEVFNTELTEKNSTILEQNHIISEQNKELSETNRAKDRLFSILSHDLRSPIGSMQQLLELIKMGDFTAEEQAGLLDEMLIQVTGTSSMLKNLLNWANSQMEGNKVSMENLELPLMVAKVVEAYYLVIKTKNIKVIEENCDGLPQIEVDKGHLSVILHNLLSNALKYTSEGREIRISYEYRNDRVLLKIFDGGQGISEEKIREIKNFNNRMISQIGTGMEIGTGVGLLLVKHFLLINGAELDIKSYPGRGSEFIVVFKKAEL